MTCLRRVGKSSDWLRLFDNTEVTIGRGADVTYQLLSPSCPLMISRHHCTFKKSEDGQWTVTDKKSMNGVWVNHARVVVEKAHPLKLGDSIQLGVPVTGQHTEFDYILVRRPLEDVRAHLSKPLRDSSKDTAHLFKKPKRKLAEETQPSTSSKRMRSSALSRDLEPERERERTGEGDMDDLLVFSQNIVMLSEQVDSRQRQVASLEVQPSQSAPFREQQVTELQNQLQTLRAKMEEMKSLEKSFNEAKQQPEVRRLLMHVQWWNVTK